jgi:hypothetical protein
VGNAKAIRHDTVAVLRAEVTDIKKYAEEYRLIEQKFNFIFQEICRHEVLTDLFSVSFDITFAIAPTEF